MSQSDFIRQMPSWGAPMGKQSIWSRLHIDVPLFFFISCLALFGLVVLYSASGENLVILKRQGQFFAVGYCAMVLIAQLSLERLQRWSIVFYLLGICLLLAVPFMGVDVNGARRWLDLGIRFQPSEILKLAVPMAVAWYLADRTLPPSFSQVLTSLVIIFIPAFLIFKQPDLGTSILVSVSGALVLFFAGMRWRLIIGAIALISASVYPLWKFVLHDYQRQRVLTLLNPESDKLGAGWNIIQSKTAIGSGGLSGKGWLSGTQSRLDFLPESHTDFIIAVLAEEYGLRGVLFLLLLYVLIISRGLWISMNAQHSYGRILAGSITLTFFIYVFVNMGMVSGVLPVVGVPLPLVSQGGTSVATLLVAFGLLMAIGAEKRLVAK